VTHTFVFDTSALIALFDAYDPVYRLRRRADRGVAVVALPAVAVAEATRAVAASAASWEAIVWPRHVDVVPRTEAAAIEIGSWPGEDLAARHALWEAAFLDGLLVTRQPDLYDEERAPLLAL
jgi:predicted nucleic acid-binding protein